MYYSFDIDLATEYGVDEAIMLYNLIFWLRKKRANGRDIHDGRAWVYNSAESLCTLFPFWNTRKISRVFISLEDKGVILSGNFNKVKYDRTKWYALEDESLLEIALDDLSNESGGVAPLDNMSNGKPNSVQPIPDLIPNQKPDKEAKASKDAIYDFFLKAFNETTGRKIRVLGPKAKRQYNALLKAGYSQADMIKAAQNCASNEFFQKKGNLKYLTPEYITRADKFSVYFDDKPTSLKTGVKHMETASV